MALRLDPAVREKYAAFYDFACNEALPAQGLFLLEHADDAAAQAQAAKADAAAVTHLIVRDCKGLTDLGFLSAFKNAEYLGVWRCPDVCVLHNTAAHPRLRGLALVGCKHLVSLAGVSGCADTLEHLFVQCGVWNNVKLESLAPLQTLHTLRTCDLGCAGVRKKCRMDYHTLYPQLESLTISAKLYPMFASEAKK